jgi:hypothetical protein
MAATIQPLASGVDPRSGFLTHGLILSAPNRWRRRPFLPRGDVPVDKALNAFRQGLVGIVGLI